MGLIVRLYYIGGAENEITSFSMIFHVDPNIKRIDVSEDDDAEDSKETDFSALHVACSNSAATDISEVVQLLVENRSVILLSYSSYDVLHQ